MTLDNNMKFKEDKEMELCKLNPGRVGTGRSLLSEKYVAPATDMDRLTGLGRNTTSFFLHLWILPLIPPVKSSWEPTVQGAHSVGLQGP